MTPPPNLPAGGYGPTWFGYSRECVLCGMRTDHHRCEGCGSNTRTIVPQPEKGKGGEVVTEEVRAMCLNLEFVPNLSGIPEPPCDPDDDYFSHTARGGDARSEFFDRFSDGLKELRALHCADPATLERINKLERAFNKFFDIK